MNNGKLKQTWLFQVRIPVQPQVQAKIPTHHKRKRKTKFFQNRTHSTKSLPYYLTWTENEGSKNFPDQLKGIELDCMKNYKGEQ